jgi:hypothetical protein
LFISDAEANPHWRLLPGKLLAGTRTHIPVSIELAFFAELTHDLIAELTGVPLGTVKGCVRLGLRRLCHTLHDLAPSTPGNPSLQMRAA